ncbi:hypothetical protein C6Y62_06030 [Hyphomicrobium sulfonivorans]|nr:hypothetical protein [Hyphomicrobium sulfonivorans]
MFGTGPHPSVQPPRSRQPARLYPAQRRIDRHHSVAAVILRTVSSTNPFRAPTRVMADVDRGASYQLLYHRPAMLHRSKLAAIAPAP